MKNLIRIPLALATLTLCCNTGCAQEFYRGDDSRHDRSHQGLGLTIAKRFIEAQGGKLELKNSECPQEGGQVSLYIAGNKDGKLDLF